MEEPLHGNQTPTAAALVVPSEVAQVRLSRGTAGIEVIDEEVTFQSWWESPRLLSQLQTNLFNANACPGARREHFLLHKEWQSLKRKYSWGRGAKQGVHIDIKFFAKSTALVGELRCYEINWGVLKILEFIWAKNNSNGGTAKLEGVRSSWPTQGMCRSKERRVFN